MDEVLTEVLELFPSKYIHIGGDEADRTAWKSCPRCRHLARELGGVDQVQCYLVEHAEKFLAEHGRTMIGWDEILKNNLRSTSTVISYRGQRGGIEAANRGYDVVMSPGEILYFDWYQAILIHSRARWAILADSEDVRFSSRPRYPCKGGRQ